MQPNSHLQGGAVLKHEAVVGILVELRWPHPHQDTHCDNCQLRLVAPQVSCRHVHLDLLVIRVTARPLGAQVPLVDGPIVFELHQPCDHFKPILVFLRVRCTSQAIKTYYCICGTCIGNKDLLLHMLDVQWQ